MLTLFIILALACLLFGLVTTLKWLLFLFLVFVILAFVAGRKVGS